MEDKERMCQIARFDQSVAQIVDTLPVLWRSVYLRLVKEGFNDIQSLEILKQYIDSSIRKVQDGKRD
jgi:hypothetical protein